MVMQQKLILAYLAGVMDSDGSFGIRRSTYGIRKRGEQTPVFSERVKLAQTSPIVPKMLKDLFGGYFARTKPYAKKGKPLYRWEGTQKVAARCIESLYPYLRIKQKQAEILIKLRESKNAQKPARWRTTIDREKLLAYWDSLFSEIRKLNDVRPQKPKLI